jgi:hypothetical protein
MITNTLLQKKLHAILLKMCNDVINMNTALIDNLLRLIPTAFKLLYKQERMMNLNTVFQQCFDWFVIKYRCTLAEDCETNWVAMVANWHFSMGFEVLTLRLFCGITFASLSGHPITDKDMVDIGVRVLNHTGLFPKEYKTWILCGNDASKTNDFFSFKTFWEISVQIAAFTAVPASQHGYGMVATNNNTSAHLLMDAMSNFGMAYAAIPPIKHRQHCGNPRTASNALPGSWHRPAPPTIATMPPEWMRPQPATWWKQRQRQWWQQQWWLMCTQSLAQASQECTEKQFVTNQSM